MSYIIRTCKECEQKVHVRQKGKRVTVNDRCVHFEKAVITVDMLESKTIPIDKLIVPIIAHHKSPQLCVLHKQPMEFRRYLPRFTELYYCPMCAAVDKLMPTKYMNWWKSKTWNKNWQTGDVKLIVSPDYNAIIKQKVT